MVKRSSVPTYQDTTAQTMKLLGQRLREAATRKGIKTADLAVKLGVSTATISNVMKGVAVGIPYYLGIANIVGFKMLADSKTDVTPEPQKENPTLLEISVTLRHLADVITLIANSTEERTSTNGSEESKEEDGPCEGCACSSEDEGEEIEEEGEVTEVKAHDDDEEDDDFAFDDDDDEEELDAEEDDDEDDEEEELDDEEEEEEEEAPAPPKRRGRPKKFNPPPEEDDDEFSL